uniref:Uncharacterized protein n=1 Tax=Ditylum brightwellii TaxID=49249 RepID=A0A6U3R716_9STRA|mmetsp:Transcript_7535/g.10968  ORF Transcript_7535/g.10968 Transcript_7535/m.10968 type:complete len:357 (-) Transcript_7535:53-1123(-)
MEEVLKNPLAARAKYEFKGGFNKCVYFPLHMVVALGASPNVVDVVRIAYPEAMKEKCNSCIGPAQGAPRLIFGIGKSVLHIACLFRASLDVLSLLLEKCPELGMEVNPFEDTPLHIACKEKASFEVVSLLLEKCPEAAKKENKFGLTPLHIACRQKASPEMISLLVEKFPDAAGMENHSYKLPLHIVCEYSPVVEVVLLLLEKEPDAVRRGDQDWDTPLHIVCKNSSAPLEVALLLLERYPEAAREKNTFGLTPLDIAHDSGCISSIVEVITSVSRILDSDANNAIAEETLKNFIEIEWWAGVPLVLDAHPMVAKALLDSLVNIRPDLLSMVGRRCKMLTMWKFISNMQDLIASNT